jgi:DNA-binding CsgD family transcriptional regulator
MLARTALLEREQELATIEALLSATGEGSGGLLTIEGEAGAGKTTLLEAADRLGGERSMRVLRARAGEYERDFPYGVMRQLFEPLLADASRRAGLLAESAALAAPVFDPQAPLRESGDPFAIQHGLYWLVADLAADLPLLLLVDDAQWADLASLQALVYLGRRLGELPAALVLGVRTGEPGPHEKLLDELRGEPVARSLVPPPLSVGAIGAMVAAEVGRQPSERFTFACRDATAGNPFLLAELLQSLDLDRLERGEGGAERLAELAAAGVSRAILTRLGKLGEHSVAVAQAVAVLEPNAEARLIADLAELPASAVADSSERLVRARLLSDSRPVAFVHPLVRAAVLSDVPEPRRAASHARAARLLDDGGGAADTVAAHLLMAEPSADDWAVAALREAAAGALGRGAPGAAVRYLRRALREPPAREDRLAVSRELGLALLRANDPEGIGVLRTVRAATADPVQRARLVIDMASSLGVRGGVEEAAALLEESLADAPAGDGELRILLQGWLLLQMFWGLERLPSIDLPAPGEEPANERIPGRMLLTQASFLNAAGLGTVERGLELAELGVPSTEILLEDAMAGLPPQGALATVALADRGESPEGGFAILLEAARRRGSLPGNAGAHGVRAFCQFIDGNLRNAQSDADIAVGMVKGFGLPGPLAIWSGVAIRASAERGDFAAAETLLAELWSGREPISGVTSAVLLTARGELRRATGRYAEARHDYLAAAERITWLPLANQEVLPWRIGLVLCEAALGNEEEAQQLAGETTELARQASGQRGIGIALRAQGAVGGGGEGIALLQEAVGVLAATRARLQYAHALVELGAALRRANRRKEAREPLRKGLDLAHRCGATPLEERARTELAATGARPRKAVLTGLESLTPSELRVARMAAGGMTNREVAQGLTVTEKTIETHMRHVFQKLDVSRRTELAGALEPDDAT